MTDRLVDRFGRRISYLRLSVTDRCDFRCVYCMNEQMQFLPRQEILSLEELLAIARAFVSLGVVKIRLTGGEPTVRHNLLWLVERIAALPGLEELALSTNGARLQTMAVPLAQAGVHSINISLDSLKSDRFGELTRTGRLDDVLSGISAARTAGFRRIKLNAVVMRGRNDDEIDALAAFARAVECDLSFIEEMPLGVIGEHDRAAAFVASDEILARLKTTYPLVQSVESTGGPSRYYRYPDHTSRVGFISPHSHNFCETCNRVRVTVEGRLLLCLGNEHSVDLRRILREEGEAALIPAIQAAMAIKPERHHFDLEEPVQIVRFMNMTGG